MLLVKLNLSWHITVDFGGFTAGITLLLSDESSLKLHGEVPLSFNVCDYVPQNVSLTISSRVGGVSRSW